MKKLKYEEVEKVYMENLRKNGLYFRPGYPPEEDTYAKGVFTMLETLVDSINQCISWEGKVVAFKAQTIIFRHNKHSVTFCPDYRVQCILDRDEELKIIHKGEKYTISRQFVYLYEKE